MSWLKAIAIVLLVPVVLLGMYVGYLAATYISESVTYGSGYGFSIGHSKAQTAADLAALRLEEPNAAVYVSYGSRAGDNFTVLAADAQLALLQPHDQWNIQLDGPDEFGNSIRLTFERDKLVQIYRHRQHFELP